MRPIYRRNRFAYMIAQKGLDLLRAVLPRDFEVEVRVIVAPA
jgi:hypothetical protein